MRVAIAGAHGEVATRLARLLVDRGDEVIGLTLNPEHADDHVNGGPGPIDRALEGALG